ncbi:MAG: NUDIX domain-containing protein [Planctomycetaceae bacterium]|nr:NUDIX domain-containing protein [Planctomycetaceae bacterium]
MAEEIFDIVDERDRVIGQMARSQVHAEKRLHRAVHIFVFRTTGELLIHLRSPDKDEQPNTWTSSASGHLSAGEDYTETAHRELEEEIGLSGHLEFLHKFDACPETSYEFTALYRMVSDDEPTFDPVEITRGEYVTLEELKSRIAIDRAIFSTAFLVLFEWYCQFLES